MNLYKLTDCDWYTRGRTLWGPGITHTAPGRGPLCSAGWIHAYEHPLLAVLHNPIHGNFTDPILWEATTTDMHPLREGQMKLGVRNLTTIKQVPLPTVTTAQRVRYAVYCAMEVCTNTGWRAWAERWLSGGDRSADAAWRAEVAAAAEVTAQWEQAAARGAAEAAEAAWRAEVAAAAEVTAQWEQASAWHAAAWHAAEAAEVAHAAVRATVTEIDLIALAIRAVEEET